MHKSTIVLGAVVGLLASGTAVGRDLPLYVGLSYGVASVDGNAQVGQADQRASVDGVPFDDDTGAWSAFAGYRLSDYIAIELGYADLGSFAGDDLGGFYRDVEVGVGIGYGTARLRYPLSQRLHVEAHLGVSRTSFDEGGYRRVPDITVDPPVIQSVPLDSIDSTTGYLVGAGVTLSLTDRLGASLEYARHDVDVFDVDVASLRVLYRL